MARQLLSDSLPFFIATFCKTRSYEAELPADPEFRSAFIAYIEWGTRIALANSQPGATPPLEAPLPRWGWGEAPPLPPFPDRLGTHDH